MRKITTRLGAKKLAAMAAEATTDCYNDSERAVGWVTVIEEHLRFPFETLLLGIPVTVLRVDMDRNDGIIAVCRRGKYRQAIPILDLPLPSPPPVGAEWVEAYRRWLCGDC